MKIIQLSSHGVIKTDARDMSRFSFKRKPSPPAETVNGSLAPKSISHDAADYSKIDQRTHIYDIPDTYIGSIAIVEREATVLDMTDPSSPVIVNKTITYPEGCDQIFMELLTNAGDNVIESRLKDVDPGKIIVNVDKQWVTVRNGGLVIPIEFREDDQVYNPEFILGILLTSSNYNKKKRCVAGRNGYGGKIVNIFSKTFICRIGDPSRGLEYYQAWGNNMLERDEPIITDGYTGEAYVEISYMLDHERFGYTEYPEEAIQLFAAHCVDVSFALHVPIVFNDNELKSQDLKSYVKYQFGADTSYLVHRQWPPGLEMVRKRGVGLVPKDSNVLPIIELALIDTPNNSRIKAFTNGLINPRGGVHVNAAIKATQIPILEMVNKTESDKSKSGKSKLAAIRLRPADFKRHVSIVVVCNVENASFKGQYKDELASPTPKITIDSKWFKGVRNWKLMYALVKELKFKIDKKLMATDGKSRGRCGVKDAESANLAGRGVANSRKCTLVITEGKSAHGYAVSFFTHLGGKMRDVYGFLPLRGKLLNVRSAPWERMINNKEIEGIKKMLRLQSKLDYSDPKVRDTMAYHKILIMTDADPDGEHIKGLIVNFLDHSFPDILKAGMVYYMRTPIVRVTNGNQQLKFYTTAEVKFWEEQTPNHSKWKYRYLKGLGSSNKEDVKDDFDTMDQQIVQLLYDEHAASNIDLLFNKKCISLRKDEIEKFQPFVTTGYRPTEPISFLMRHKVLAFSVEDVRRSIPHFSGLKDVQNKIIFAAFKRWKTKIGQKGQDSFKLGRFAPNVSSVTEYEHGEDSICKAIIGMAQDFTGTNNLPLFFPNGNFGTRTKNGKDAAAPRYPFTYPRWCVPLIFRKEDTPLLVRRIDEGKELEFIRYRPIVPLMLMNGILGIATGFSTYIPPYNPMDLCIWVALKLRNQPLDDFNDTLQPWFRGFLGDLEVVIRDPKRKIITPSSAPSSAPSPVRKFRFNSKGKEENDGEDEEEEKPLIVSAAALTAERSEDEDPDMDPLEMLGDNLEFGMDRGTSRNTNHVKRAMVVTGCYKHCLDRSIVITEIPIGRSIHSYVEQFEEMIKEKRITDFANNSIDNSPKFTIKGLNKLVPQPDDYTGPPKTTEDLTDEEIIKMLRLRRSYGISNMTLLDDNGSPKYYETVIDILETFFYQRINEYGRRKESVLKGIATRIQNIDWKIILITAIVEKRLKIRNRPLTEIRAAMDQLGVPHEYLNKMNLSKLSTDEIEKMKIKRADEVRIMQEYQIIEPTSIWESDLKDFVKAYLQHYPEDLGRLTDKFTHMNELISNTCLASFAAKAKLVKRPKIGFRFKSTR
jgi:DNA topoisomerase II